MERKIVLSEQEIQEICKRLGKQITADFKDHNKTPIIIGVMKGSLNFMMDLIKRIEMPIFTDYIQISSYEGTSSNGNVVLKRDLSEDIKDREIILVEDVVDSGRSIKFLKDYLEKRNPKQIYICSLFDKVNARSEKIHIDYVGKELVENDFLIGYGLDYYELERNVPYVYSATKEEVEKLDHIYKTK